MAEEPAIPVENGEKPAEVPANPLDDWHNDPFACDPTVMLLEDIEERRKVVLLKKSLESSPDTENEDSQGMYDDPLCLIRYLRARKWDLEKAEEMIRNTARWRKTFDLRGVREGAYAEMVAELNVQSTLYVRGYNRKASPALYVLLRNERSSNYEAIIRHLVYNLERGIACIERQLEEGNVPLSRVDTKAGKLVLLVAFADLSFKNLVPMSVVREAVCILQDHYPERLQQAFIFDAPWILNAFLNAVSSMMDPVTQEKFQFVGEEGEERKVRMSKTFDLAQLEQEMGGSSELAPFDSSVYLSTKRDGTEFGCDFNEQLSLAEAEAAEARLQAAAVAGVSGPLRPSFWEVSSNRRTLSLPRKERGLVRELARSLASNVDGLLEEDEGLYNDAGALIRHLTSQAWNPAKAEEKIRATARWRKDFGLMALRSGTFAEAVARESASGKMYVRGFDRRGRPIVYVKLHSRDSGNYEETLKYTVYCLERAIACLEHRSVPMKIHRFAPDDGDAEVPLDGKITVVVDFSRYSRHNRPALKTIRAAMGILQDHYPERLGEAYLMWPPLRVTAFWRAIRRMVDPAMYQKVVVVRDADLHKRLLSTVFDKVSLEKCAGGEVDDAFDSQIFLSKQVNGDVYGSEFNAQLAASSCGRQGAYDLVNRRVSFANEVDLLAKENGSSGTFFESLFGGGGGNTSLW